jgi:anti-sigma B factor antagonist
MEFTEREKEGIRIIDLEGKLTVGGGSEPVRSRLKELAEKGVKNVILNLAGVDYIDSTGLGMLVVCFTTFRKAGGALKLLNLSRRNIELLLLTKLETVFEIFDDEQDAVNSFFPNRQVKKFDILAFIQQQERE